MSTGTTAGERCENHLLARSFISNRSRPVNTWPFFFSNRLRNLAFFFVPGVNRAKTVDFQGCGVSRPKRSNQLFVYVVLSRQNLARPATFNSFSAKRRFVTK